MIFAAASSDVFNNNAIDGSMLQLDSVSFTGAASQPALFNGDFETWQSKTVDKPTSWNYNSGEAWQGLLRSTDAHGGSYALELKNILSSDSTGPISFPTLLGTGYWDCSTGTCIQKGGYPYNKTKDTLTFYYKYAPTIATDSAQVTILFRKNGNVFDIRGADLKDAATYQYTEIPFILGQAPDSVSIQFNSGLFSNTAVGYAGADFKVDDVKFKSQTVTTGLQDLINESHTKVFPNPGKGIFNFTSAIKITGVEVTNLYGQRVYTAKTDGMQIAIDLTAQPKGVYIYTLRNKTKITARGKIVIQ
ncbi:MAG: T9SS type A sorting domain-containing protein [Sphingobacteriales bacterium]|nr:T9SS type A sorting domain-containing protein [Sphingobacteriales bacterium]